MYDITCRKLVMSTPTVHPILGHHTGFIFAEYEPLADEPRFLFFEHHLAAQLFAAKRGADLLLNPADAPERMAPEDYLDSFHNPYADMNASDLLPRQEVVRRSRVRAKKQREAKKAGHSLGAQPKPVKDDVDLSYIPSLVAEFEW